CMDVIYLLCFFRCSYFCHYYSLSLHDALPIFFLVLRHPLEICSLQNILIQMVFYALLMSLFLFDEPQILMTNLLYNQYIFYHPLLTVKYTHNNMETLNLSSFHGLNPAPPVTNDLDSLSLFFIVIEYILILTCAIIFDPISYKHLSLNCFQILRSSYLILLRYAAFKIY